MPHRRLIVNLEHIAELRNRGPGWQPDPVAVAALVRLAGADGVSLHLRLDRTREQERDARLLRETLEQGLAVDISADPTLLRAALELHADRVTLVEFRPGESESAEGVDLLTRMATLGEFLRTLDEAKLDGCVCVDADLDQIKAAHRLGAHGVRLYCGRVGRPGLDLDRELRRVADAARLARKLGLSVCAGGGIDYDNVRWLREIDDVQIFQVGHALTARALFTGLERAVQEMRDLVA